MVKQILLLVISPKIHDILGLELLPTELLSGWHFQAAAQTSTFSAESFLFIFISGLPSISMCFSSYSEYYVKIIFGWTALAS